MGGYLANAIAILVDVGFGLIVLLFTLRVLLQLVRANFRNPLCQFVYRATNPVLAPLRRVLKPIGSFDLASSIVVFVLQCIKVWILGWLGYSRLFKFMGGLILGVSPTLVLGLAETLRSLTWFFIGAVLIRVILSWVQTAGYNPIVPLLHQLTNPLLIPLRKRLPTPGGFDWAPLVLTIALYLFLALVVDPLQDAGILLTGP
jgi:YggT family protein